MESYEKIKKVLALGFMNFLDDNKSKGKMCLSNGECEDIEKAFNEKDWTRLAGYLDKYTESEDERIRKKIIEHFKSKTKDTWCNMPVKSILDWLEKQKERGPLTKEEEYILHRIIEHLEDETCPSKWISLLHDIYCLPYPKQKEQKPNYCHHEVDETGWTEEYRKAYYDGWNNCNMQHEQLKAGHKPTEWSEEDEAMLDSVIRIITQIDDLAHEPTFAGPKWTHPYTKEIAWLKSIRPQPKQEWSDEDEKIFNNIIEKAKGGHWIEVNEITWLINRFKSLRPSWKPSEEQMKALGASIVFHKNDPNTDLLRSLYDDLQKIR